jgi:hypothetical protein
MEKHWEEDDDRRKSSNCLGVRDSHRDPLTTGGKPVFFLKQNTNELAKHKTRPRRSRPSGRGPPSWRPQRPTRTASPRPPRAKLHFARGIRHHTDKTPPRSRTGRPLGRDSTSLKGWTPPRARLRVARGSHGLSAPTPAPPTVAFNVLTHAGTQVKDESTPCRPSDTPGNHIPALFSQPSR